MDTPISGVVFMLVLARMLGVALAVPDPVGRSVGGWRFRVAFALLVALMVAPVCHVEPTLAAADWTLLSLKMATELVVGVVLGVGVHILFAGVQVVAQLMSTSSGMSLAGILTGSGSNAPLTRLLDYLSLAIFLAIGGHRLVMGVILTTFREAPLGTCQFHGDLISSLASLLSLSFALGLRASFPVLAAMIMAILVVGLLGRFLPRFQLFLSSASINSVVLIGSLFLFMGTVGWTLQEQMPVYLERLVLCLGASF